MPRNMVKRLLVGKSERSMIYLREKALFGREPRGAFFEATARSTVTCTFLYTKVNYT
jgi:hypothetical protein